MSLTAAYDPYDHAARIGRQLRAWALGSVLIGAALIGAAVGTGVLSEGWDRIALGFGVQCLVWGAIDGVIAWFGGRDLRRRLAAGERGDPAAARPFAHRLRRLLLVNAGLDVLYVAAGVALIVLWRTPDGLGHGLGVLVQGGFLLAFDVWHGARVGPVEAPGGHATR